MMEQIANAFRKEADICSFTPYKQVQWNKEKLPVPINRLKAVWIERQYRDTQLKKANEMS